MSEEKKVPTVPAPVVEEKHPDGALILKGANGIQFWPTEEKAASIANGRVKGARHAFKVTDGAGKVRYATGAHMHYVMEYIVEVEQKTSVDQVGRPASSRTPVTAASLLAAIDSFPEAEREALRKQIEAKVKGK